MIGILNDKGTRNELEKIEFPKRKMDKGHE